MHQLVFKDLVDIGEQCNRATMLRFWLISLIVDCHFDGPFACCIKQLNSRASRCDISLENLLNKCRLISAWPAGLYPWNSSRFFPLFSSLSSSWSFPPWTFWLDRGWSVMSDDNSFWVKSWACISIFCCVMGAIAPSYVVIGGIIHFHVSFLWSESTIVCCQHN